MILLVVFPKEADLLASPLLSLRLCDQKLLWLDEIQHHLRNRGLQIPTSNGLTQGLLGGAISGFVPTICHGHRRISSRARPPTLTPEVAYSIDILIDPCAHGGVPCRVASQSDQAADVLLGLVG